MSNQPVIEALNQALADSYTLYLKTQNYHWNVTGPHFVTLHELFETHYTDLATAIDEIAERIRTLGAEAPGSYAAFSKLTHIQEAKPATNASAMVKELTQDQETLLATLQKLLKKAEQSEDIGTEDLATQRIAVHEKNRWMLQSLLEA